MENSRQIIRHISIEELKVITRKEKNRYVHERLLFIYQLYLGDSVPEACQRICISEQTGYDWLDLWNKKGHEGLNPDFGGGRPSKITEDQKEDLKEKLVSKNWLTSEVRALIKKDFNVIYSIRQIIRMLKGFGMHYAKPYPQDYRRPENAKELLENSIREVVDQIPSNTVIGFFDQASPQTTDNKQRVWSFNKPRKIKNTTKYRANTFGFYPINGNEAIDFKEDSKIHSICDFLRSICMKNPGKHILLFLDNFRSHTANATRIFAKSIGITLVFLPKYSPNFNPIEFIWKSVKRKVSQIYAKSEWSFKETIRTCFHRFAKKKSFMTGWLEKFEPGLSKLF